MLITLWLMIKPSSLIAKTNCHLIATILIFIFFNLDSIFNFSHFSGSKEKHSTFIGSRTHKRQI